MSWGPSDAYYEPPDPTTEEDECKRCGQVAQVGMRSRLCMECEEADFDAEIDRQIDERKERERGGTDA